MNQHTTHEAAQRETATVNFATGNPLPAAGLSTDSSLLNINGSTGSDTLLTTANVALFGTAEIRHPSSTAVTFLNAGPGDVIDAVAGTVTLAGDPTITAGGPTVIVSTGASVLFTGTQHLSALDILPGGTARMVQNGSNVLVTNSLSISGPDSYNNSGGVLDLADNDLIVHTTTNTSAGTLSAIAGDLKTGYDNMKWDGEGSTPTQASILSSIAAADSTFAKALGYAQVGTNASIGQLNLSSFDAQTVYNGDVLVKSTVYGDANLDGTVDQSDMEMLNIGFTNNLSGWSNGDFYYNGSVTGADQQLMAGIEVDTPSDDPPPGALTVTPESSTQIYVQWTNYGSLYMGYYVAAEQPGSDSAAYKTVGSANGNGASILVSNLTPDTTYDFKLYGFNDTGSTLLIDGSSGTEATTFSPLQIYWWVNEFAGLPSVYQFGTSGGPTDASYTWEGTDLDGGNVSYGTTDDPITFDPSTLASITAVATASNAPSGAFDSMTYYLNAPILSLKTTSTGANDFVISDNNGDGPYTITDNGLPIRTFYSPNGVAVQVNQQTGSDQLELQAYTNVTLYAEGGEALPSIIQAETAVLNIDDVPGPDSGATATPSSLPQPPAATRRPDGSAITSVARPTVARPTRGRAGLRFHSCCPEANLPCQ